MSVCACLCVPEQGKQMLLPIKDYRHIKAISESPPREFFKCHQVVMTWQDIITSQLITWAPPHHAQVHRRFQRFSFHAGGTNVRGNHRQHAQCLHTFHTQINTGVSTHADTALIFRASDHAEYGAVKFISECSQGSRTFKCKHQGFVNAEPVKLGQGWGEDALHDQRVHWFDGLTVPCCWGEEDVFRGKKKENKLHRKVYLNSNY